MRANLLRLPASVLVLAIGLHDAVAQKPAIKVQASSRSAALPFFSLDAEGSGREVRNLLRSGSKITLQSGGTAVEFIEATTGGNSADYALKTSKGADLLWHLSWSAGRLTCRFESPGHDVVPLELRFPFDPHVTATTLLASDWEADGSASAPALLSAPDFGQLMLQAEGQPVRLRVHGNYAARQVDVVIEGRCGPSRPLTISLTPWRLPQPAGVDKALWTKARRGWFGAIQTLADNGEDTWDLPAGRTLVRKLHPPGMLGNEVISGNATCSTWFYADHVFWIPQLAPGVSAAQMLRRTLDLTLDVRVEPSGRLVGYWMPTRVGAYADFLDSQPSVLIAAWDYVEVAGDLDWLNRRIAQLERAADYLASRDINGDGLVEAAQSGNDGTLSEPERGASWWDAVNSGWQDGYVNALTFRAWCCLADLEQRLGREEKANRYRQLARRLKGAYAHTLWSESSGWLGWWRSKDGVLHDPAALLVNSLAVEYRLLDEKASRTVLARFRAELERVGYKRFDLGVPASLRPLRREEYLLGIPPGQMGAPALADGSDALGQYQNGGVHAGHALHWLAAHYRMGEGKYADAILRKMLDRQVAGLFQNGVWGQSGKGIEWTAWDGKPSGADGYLSDNFRFLQALFLREPSLRSRYYRPLDTLPSAPAEIGEATVQDVVGTLQIDKK
jgi:hypothetical protein